MRKPDGLFGRSVDEKSGIDAHFFQEKHLLELANDNIAEEEDAEDVELKGIDVATHEKKNELWVVPQERRLEVLRQHHNSHVAGQWGRHRTPELV